MKKVFTSDWLTEILPMRILRLQNAGAPSRRHSIPSTPWLPASLMAPFVVFLLVTGARKLRNRNAPGSSWPLE